MPLNKPKSSMLDAGSTAAPQNLGATASAGTGPDFAFADHVHPLPTPAQIGALSTSQISGLASTAPAALAVTAAVGTSTSAARADHVHARPTATEVGAIASTQKAAANGVASLDANARLNAVQMPAISGDITIAAGTTTAAVDKVKGKSVATPTVAGTIAQYDGTNIVWGSAPAGGSGGGGVVMFFNNGTTGDAPLTNLPALTGGQTYKELRRAAETVETSVVSPALSATYTNIAGFITDVNDPETVEITAGLWDFNVWAQTIDARTMLRAVLYKYDGATTSSVTLATSAAVSVPTVAGQLVFSLIIPQTTIALTDRIFIVFQALNPAAGHTVTLQFGGSTPSHTHTTLPSVGKSGVVKVINGVTQADASKIVDADVDDAAAIAQSKIDGLTTALSGKVGTGDTIAIARGGTGQTDKASAFNALSPITTAGDLIIGTGANAAGRLGIGTNGQVLTSNGTTASWQAPAGGSGVTSIANGGTGATTESEARIAMGGAVLVDHNITSAIVGTMNTGVTPNTLTYTTPAVLTIDSIAPSVGDTVFVSAQASTSTPGQAANGPWIITQVGTATLPTILTRPSWFSGTVRGILQCVIRYGNTNAGITRIAVGPLTTGTKSDITVGTSAILGILGTLRTNVAGISGNTYTGRQTFAAGTSSVNAFSFQAGSLLTNVTAHAVEYDGSSMYLTPTSAIRKKVSFLEDGVSIVTSALTATPVTNFDIESFEVVYCTANATVDPIINFRGSSTLTINAILEVNKARTVNVMLTNGATAYKMTSASIQIDGVTVPAQNVKWLGGTAPTAGNANSIDSYSFTIIKTAATPSYMVLASLIRFA